MSKPQVKENSFDGAPGGGAGSLTYQAPYATPASPDVSQNPGAFDSNNRNKAANQPQKGVLKKDVDQLYANPRTAPTPDDVITGLKYETGQQIKKDPASAKKIVIANLKKDPKFYTSLKHLNITDRDMVDNMTENRHPNDAPERPKIKPNIEETKKIFAEMAVGYGKKYVVNSQICDVMKEMWAAKNARNAWRNGG
jgi:hypothetical protein